MVKPPWRFERCGPCHERIARGTGSCGVRICVVIRARPRVTVDDVGAVDIDGCDDDRGGRAAVDGTRRMSNRLTSVRGGAPILVANLQAVPLSRVSC